MPRPVPHCDHVPETAFGKWFLRTETWSVHVLDRALRDLEQLIPERRPSYPVIADVGCGWGRSLKKLQVRFAPQRLIAIDVDPAMVRAALDQARRDGLAVEGLVCSGARMLLPDASVDLLFCHQTFHHLVEQEAAIAEWFRVLRPGGLLLFAESTRRYIHSWVIRLLFRHPMQVQKSAAEYLALVRSAGFGVGAPQVSYPFLWWSREDFGIAERWFRIAPPSEREETLINLVAVKPAGSPTGGASGFGETGHDAASTAGRAGAADARPVPQVLKRVSRGVSAGSSVCDGQCIGRMAWLVLLLSWLGVATAQAITVAGLQRLLKEAPTRELRFSETRESQWLSAPAESSGSMRSGATMLEKEIELPRRETWRILDDRMQLITPGSTVAKQFMFSESPAVATLAGALRHVMAGDMQALDKDFRLLPSGDERLWTLQLSPRREDVARFLRYLELQGNAQHLQLIVVVESNGDRTTTRLTSAP